MTENWCDVVGFEGRYEVSDLGRIRSLERPLNYKDGRKGTLKGGPIKGAIGNAGYVVVTLDSTNKRLLHRLIAEAFLPCPSIYRVTVNHKDGNKTNNCLSNLEWATFAENNAHARKSGLNKQHGENCNLSKYQDRFIQAVRNVHKTYSPTFKDLGNLFGIGTGHAHQIVKNKTRNSA